MAGGEVILNMRSEVRGLRWCLIRLRMIAAAAGILGRPIGRWHVRIRTANRYVGSELVVRSRFSLHRGPLPAGQDGFEVTRLRSRT